MVFVWMKNQKGNKQPEACLNESWKVAFFLAEVQGAGWQHYPFLIDNNCLSFFLPDCSDSEDDSSTAKLIPEIVFELQLYVNWFYSLHVQKIPDFIFSSVPLVASSFWALTILACFPTFLTVSMNFWFISSVLVFCNHQNFITSYHDTKIDNTIYTWVTSLCFFL